MHKYVNMKSIQQVFRVVDIGGVHPVHTVQGQGNLYKSVKGGVLSTIILVLSTSYACYVLYTWITGQILPKAQTSKQSIDYQEFYFDYNPMSFTIDTPQKYIGKIDPFQQDQIILIPIVQITNNQALSQPDFLVPGKIYPKVQRVNLTASQSTRNITLVDNQHPDTQKPPFKNETQILLTFLKCQPYLLQPNQSCANQTVVDEFSSIPAKSIVMAIYFKEFDKDSQSFVDRSKSYYFYFDDSQALYTQVVIRTKQLTVSQGLLFQSKIKKDFVYSVEVQTQTVSKKELQNLFHTEAYATFYIRLDSMREFEDISYPTLGEVGAQISTIVGILFWMKLLIVFYNTRQYQSELVNVIIQQQSQNLTLKATGKQDNISKELALERTNIFNVHIELAKMRCILDQIVDKNYSPQLEKQQIGITTNNIQKDNHNLQMVSIKKPKHILDKAILIKEPDKIQQAQFSYQFQIDVDNKKNYYFDPPGEDLIDQQHKLIRDLDRIQKPFNYQIYQD